MNSITAAPTRRGAAEVARFLVENGHKHVFGLPGSSMVAALHELQNTNIRYVPTIHEAMAIAAADGYARVAGSAMAMIYMAPGTANGLANIYNAWRDETPLIVVASQQISTMRTREGTVGEADLVRMVEPFTRLSHELSLGAPVRQWLERARRSAGGSPSGPAFLSMPSDVFEEMGPVIEERLTERVPPGAPNLAKVIAALREATSPLLVVGGQVRRYGGVRWVERLAEEHAIAVAYAPGFNDRLSLGPGHPNLVGSLASATGAAAERAADLVLVVGARYVSEAHPRPTPFFANANFIAHVNADAAKLEETRVATWSTACDPAAFLRDLAADLPPTSTSLKVSRRRWIEEIQATPPPSAAFARTVDSYRQAVAPLHDALERGWLVDESVMASNALVAALKSADGRRYVGTSGASLGWATGASVGVALASGEPVTCVLGDGALRFGMHGLWTAAAETLPITYVILDNGGYGSTRYFERAYVEKLGPQAVPQRPSYLGMDFREMGPPLEPMIQGLGVPCLRVGAGPDARAAIEAAWASSHDGPNAVVITVPFGEERD